MGRTGRPSFRDLLALSVLLFGSSCAAARINQFKEFSEAGIAYSQATNLLMDEATRASIDVDSTILIRTRESLPTPADRLKELNEHNRLLKKRIELLSDLERHADLLKMYFVTLGSLASGGPAGDISQSSQWLFEAMGQLNQRITNTEIAGASVSSFIQPAVSITVAHFQKKALEEELRKRAPTIERELEIQNAAIQFLSEELQADLQIEFNETERTKVVEPFSQEGRVPSNWMRDRRDILTSSLSLKTIEMTADAAQNLKSTFTALVEGREVNLTALSQDLSQLIAFLQSVRKE